MSNKETIEEAAEKLFPNAEQIGGETYTAYKGFIAGTQWQAERMYSEEEVERIAKDAYSMGRNNILVGVFNKWFEQFKQQNNEQ